MISNYLELVLNYLGVTLPTFALMVIALVLILKRK